MPLFLKDRWTHLAGGAAAIITILALVFSLGQHVQAYEMTVNKIVDNYAALEKMLEFNTQALDRLSARVDKLNEQLKRVELSANSRSSRH